MAKLKGVLLTEGMHGMISQVEGLAKALDIDFTHHKVELNYIYGNSFLQNLVQFHKMYLKKLIMMILT